MFIKKVNLEDISITDLIFSKEIKIDTRTMEAFLYDNIETTSPGEVKTPLPITLVYKFFEDLQEIREEEGPVINTENGWSLKYIKLVKCGVLSFQVLDRYQEEVNWLHIRQEILF